VDTLKTIITTYDTPQSQNPISTFEELPSKEETVAILEALEGIFFPGYRSEQFSFKEGIATFIRRKLDIVYDLLYHQVLKCIPFRWKGEYAQSQGKTNPGIDIEAEAMNVTESFFEKIPKIRESLKKDVRSAYNGDPAALSYAEVILSYPGIAAVSTYRVAHELYLLDVPIMPRIMTEYIHSHTGIDIHPGAKIGEAFFIDHGTGVVIGETCQIGNNVKLYQGVTLGAKSFPLDKNGNPIKGIKRHPTIGDNVIIYAGATILGNITIGENSIIGGNVWLTKSVPPYSHLIQTPAGLKEINNKRGTK
jgi:serine O-acetyltransferase